MKNLFLIFFSLILLLPLSSKAQDGGDDQYNYYSVQLLTVVTPPIVNSMTKEQIEVAIIGFHQWKLEVINSHLLDRFTIEIMQTREYILEAIKRVASFYHDNCLLPQEDFRLFFKFKELLEWGIYQEDVVSIGRGFELEGIYEQITDCIKLRFKIHSTIIAKSMEAPITATVDSQININAQITPFSELTLEGVGDITYNDIYIPPFSPECTTSYQDIPSTYSVNAVEGVDNEYTRFWDLKVTIDPGAPSAEIIVTCRGISVPQEFYVWEPIWRDLHWEERVGSYNILQDWLPTENENRVKKDYHNARGDITEETTVQLEFR